ncbi:hypothetical protein [Cribrihabitans pelagius]|uniref:hypothetical protein n=1 Tax=Cribrihabitans pelagius TaxID=1765746 RepID=UPI003B5CED09
MVSVDRRFGNCKPTSAGHAAGSALVAEHLYQLWHRRIVYISGPQTTEVGRLRKKGFCEKLEELAAGNGGLELRVRERQFDYASGEAIARSLLDGAGGRPAHRYRFGQRSAGNRRPARGAGSRDRRAG